jgi:hypothetical protein
LTFKEINALFSNIRKILAKLDKIYHMLEDKDNRFQTFNGD